MKKLVVCSLTCALLFLATLILSAPAFAQQGDAALGFGTIMSPGASSCLSGNGCPESGGLYPNISADVIFHSRIGFQYEVTWRGGQGLYGGTDGVPYRPIINDFNAMFQPRLGKKIGLDVSAGVGFQDTRLYSANYSCSYFSCTNYTSVNHFLVDVGGGLRYYFWHHVFIRPEARYYNVLNNTANFNVGSFGYSSNSILRVGASLGYTIGGGPD